MRLYGHVLQKNIDWVKKFMEYEVEVPDQEVDKRGPIERLCKKAVMHVNGTGSIL